MNKIVVNDQLRIARAAARAEAAAARAEQLVQMLEAHAAPASDGAENALEGISEAAPALHSERLQVIEGAILDLAGMAADLLGGE